MSRPPLALGTWGEIRTYITGRDGKGKPTGYRAVTNYRDYSGKVKQFERTGKTKTAAVNSLITKLKEQRESTNQSQLTAQHLFSHAAALWLEKFTSQVKDGNRSAGSLQTYQRQLDNHVLPALQSLRLREITTPILDQHIEQIKVGVSAATAKTCRSVISGILKFAVRYGAIPANPIREIGSLEGGRKTAPRALNKSERAAWIARLEADDKAVRKDLPDLTRFMLATGARIGEALAVLWSEVDLQAGIVQITSTITRVKSVGLLRTDTKSKAGQRTLLLPSWAIAMLKRRSLLVPDQNQPVFPDSFGGFRDPSNTQRDLREARGTEEFAWVVSHNFRKTTATIIDEAKLTPRMAADQLGHAKPSMTQDYYFARNLVHPEIADALEDVFDDGQTKDMG